MTSGNHCAHVTKFYQTKIDDSDTMSEDEVFKLLGLTLIYLTAEH